MKNIYFNSKQLMLQDHLIT